MFLPPVRQPESAAARLRGRTAAKDAFHDLRLAVLVVKPVEN